MDMDLRGRRVTVMGLGRFGGGVGAVQFLATQQACVTVTDLLPAEDLAESLRQIDGLPVTLHLGGHCERDFTDCDLLVVSPAVPRDNRFLRLAIDARVPVSSEMSLFWQSNPGRTVCITGSSGKSTTTTLLFALLSAGNRRCWLGGNIGKSLLPVVHEIQPDDWVVLELSSFQLEDLAPLQPEPELALVTNLLPNHLDRHGTLEAYRSAKQNLLRWQRPDQLAVLNQEDADVSGWPTDARTLWFGTHDAGREGMFRLPGTGSPRALFRWGGKEQILPLGDWLKLPGEHNLQNALAAACAALALGESPVTMATGMRGYTGLPHRLETVAEVGGRKFVNDSKSTTPTATVLALQTFDDPIVLLAGGYDKEIDLSAMVDAIVSKPVRAVALLGTTAPLLDRLLAERDRQGRVVRKVCDSLATAFNFAMEQSQPGDIVLLSPGCASYDWFRNYEERGEEFTKLARGTNHHDAG